MRVALATCAELPDGDEDAPPLAEALRTQGVEATSTVWDDPTVAWADFDLVVIRSAWDYAERREAFLEWARSLPAVLNPVDVLVWNTDKELYLGDLERAGVPVVPTTYVRPGEPFEPTHEPFVVKPSVSAGGRSSAHFDAASPAAEELVRTIHAEGRTVMVQPFLGAITETALVFVDGEYSHALHRRVGLPSGAKSILYLEEELTAGDPTAQQLEVARRAMAASPGAPLYGRVDLVDGMVLELELAEPSLYLAFGEGAAERFAASIAREAAASQRRRISDEKGPTTSQ